MKNLLLNLAICAIALSCKFGKEEFEHVNLSVNIADEVADFESIDFKVYSLQDGQRLPIDSMGGGGKFPPFEKQEVYPHYLFDIGLRYTHRIDTVKNGFYEVILILRDGKKIRKDFGKFELGKSQRQFTLFFSRDSTITVY